MGCARLRETLKTLPPNAPALGTAHPLPRCFCARPPRCRGAARPLQALLSAASFYCVGAVLERVPLFSSLRRFGTVLRLRILDCVSNWESRPWRSAAEWSLWFAAAVVGLHIWPTMGMRAYTSAVLVSTSSAVLFIALVQAIEVPPAAPHALPSIPHQLAFPPTL